MRKMGFDARFVNMIILFITMVQYNITINSNLVGPITPGHVLLQGDPLSPYLYIICAEGLIALMKQVEAREDLHGCHISRGAPSLSHLLFTDDNFFFFNAFEQEARKIHAILGEYEKILGQVVNFHKSVIFSSNNVPDILRRNISAQLGVDTPLNTGRYPRLPSLIGRSKRAIFAYLRERLWNRLQGW